MKESPIPVIAAIPTWNMANQVIDLVSALQTQEYDYIVVLDDHSTDDTLQRLNQTFGEDVVVVNGEENLGAAGNRNRILSVMGRLGLDDETIINFIDADTQPLLSDKPFNEYARDLFRDYPQAGIIAGKVLNADGTWCAFNYGPQFSLRLLLAGLKQARIERISKTDPDRSRWLYTHNRRLLKGYPDPFSEPRPCRVGHVIETFTFIKAGTYKKIGGYDRTLRYCEALDLAGKLARLGLEQVFDPRIGVRHLQTDVRGRRRSMEIMNATLRITGRYLLGKY